MPASLVQNWSWRSKSYDNQVSFHYRN